MAAGLTSIRHCERSFVASAQNCSAILSRAPRNDGWSCGKFDTTGKSLLFFRNRVKPWNQKYSAGHVGKSLVFALPSRPARGAFRDRHDALGRGCDGRFGVRRGSPSAGRKRRGVRPSRVVLTPVAGAKFVGSVPQTTVTKQNSLTGESTKYAVKPLRGEGRDVSAEPVCSCAPNAQLLAHETAGAVGTRLSLRPLFKRGPTNLQKLGQIMPRDRGRSE